MDELCLEKSFLNFLKEVSERNLVIIDEATEYTMIEQLKKCILFDVEIQKLIEYSNDSELNANVNVLTLHNNTVPKQISISKRNKIHLDNMGFFSFEYLEQLKVKENKEYSFIYVPKKKTNDLKIQNEEIINSRIINKDLLLGNNDKKLVSYDRILKEYDYDYFKNQRCDLNDKVKSRVSLSKTQHKVLKAEIKNHKESSCFLDNVYKIGYLPKKDADGTIYIDESAKYTNISCANIVSFLFYYNRPNDFYLYELFKKDDKSDDRKERFSCMINHILDNIQWFADNQELKKYLKNDDLYQNILLVDKIIFMQKLDYLFNWILFSSCYEKHPLYIKEKGNDNIYAFLRLMNLTSLRNKKVNYSFYEINNMFFSKWYLLSLVKFIKIYDDLSFDNLIYAMSDYFLKLKEKEYSKNEMIDDLKQSENLFSEMLGEGNVENNRTNYTILNILSDSFTKMHNPVVRLNKLKDFGLISVVPVDLNEFDENSSIENIKQHLYDEIICFIKCYYEGRYDLKESLSIILNDKNVLLSTLAENKELRMYIEDGLDLIKDEFILDDTKNSFSKVQLEELVDELKYNPFGLENLIKECF